MNLNFVDVPELAKGHPHVRAALRVIEGAYRDYQGHLMAFKSRWHPECQACWRAYISAVDVLAEQVAELVTVPPDAIKTSIKGHMWNRCGSPSNPKGFEEWNENETLIALP